MKSSPLEGKTVRPGLAAYSFYRSDRHPAGRVPVNQAVKTGAKAPSRFKKRAMMRFVIVLLIAIGLFLILHKSADAPAGKVPTAGTPLVAGTDKTNHCQNNTADKFIIVSITERHLWACQAATTVYDSPVITGMEKLDADRTPVGTYTIYAKQTNTTLTGTDSTGSWSDPVYYWMPFLDNQHGTYGFHDATWRPDNAFGNIDPNSSDASHGCVELPLAVSKWLYNWAQVGTAVTVEN